MGTLLSIKVFVYRGQHLPKPPPHGDHSTREDKEVLCAAVRNFSLSNWLPGVILIKTPQCSPVDLGVCSQVPPLLLFQVMLTLRQLSQGRCNLPKKFNIFCLKKREIVLINITKRDRIFIIKFYLIFPIILENE